MVVFHRANHKPMSIAVVISRLDSSCPGPSSTLMAQLRLSAKAFGEIETCRLGREASVVARHHRLAPRQL